MRYFQRMEFLTWNNAATVHYLTFSALFQLIVKTQLPQNEKLAWFTPKIPFLVICRRIMHAQIPDEATKGHASNSCIIAPNNIIGVR